MTDPPTPPPLWGAGPPASAPAWGSTAPVPTYVSHVGLAAEQPAPATSPDLTTRGLARVTDWVVVALAAYLVGLPFGFWNPISGSHPHPSQSTSFQWVEFVVALAVLAYEPVMLVWRGQTLGKILTGLRVETADRDPIGVLTALKRHSLSLILRIGWIGAIVFFINNPLRGFSFASTVSTMAGTNLTSLVIVLALILAGLNLVTLVVAGESLYDKFGGTRVIIDPAVEVSPADRAINGALVRMGRLPR